MNHLELWHDVYLVIGTSAGALVGLLFIVMSIHIDRIEERTDDDMHATIDAARFNTFHLLTVLVESAVILTPQPLYLIGIELVVLNLFGLRLPLTIIKRYFRRKVNFGHKGGFPMVLILTIIGAYLLGIAGGIALFRLLEWGMYLVTVSCVIKLVRSVLTAWMLMFSGRIKRA